MPGLFLRRTIGAWSGGTRVVQQEELENNIVRVRIASGRSTQDEEFRRERIIEVSKNDLVVRKN